MAAVHSLNGAQQGCRESGLSPGRAAAITGDNNGTERAGPFGTPETSPRKTMSVSAVSGGSSAISKLASPKPPKPPAKPQSTTDVDGDHDGSSPAEAAAEKSGKIDVTG